jgi:hypothetical protein
MLHRPPKAKESQGGGDEKPRKAKVRRAKAKESQARTAKKAKESQLKPRKAKVRVKRIAHCGRWQMSHSCAADADECLPL